MQLCPHCNERTISNWKKLWSVTVTPVQCSACKQFSYLHAGHALKGLTFWIGVSWVFIGLALYAKATFLLLGSFPALYLAINYFMLQAPMRAIIIRDQD